jgi:hypothetical protein
MIDTGNMVICSCEPVLTPVNLHNNLFQAFINLIVLPMPQVIKTFVMIEDDSLNFSYLRFSAAHSENIPSSAESLIASVVHYNKIISKASTTGST